MQLYKFELGKVLRNRFTAVTGGVLMTAVIGLLVKEYVAAERMILEFGAAAGTVRFLRLSQFFFCYLSVWLMAVFAPLYCEDRQYRTDVLLLTTVKGKRGVFWCRLQALLTVTMGAFFFLSVLLFFFCILWYGYPEETLLVRDVVYGDIALPLAKQTAASFIRGYLIMAFCAFVLLDTFIVWVSVYSKKVQYACMILLGMYFLPGFLEGFWGYNHGNIGYIFVTSQPVLLIVLRCFTEGWPIYGLRIFIAGLLSGTVVWHGRKRWASVPDI